MNSVKQGDCLEMLRRIPDGTFKGVVTSPPYNLKNSSGNGMKSHGVGKWPNAALQQGYAEHDDCMPHEEYVAWQRECLSEMMRVTREDGAIFYNHKWRVQRGLHQDRADIMEGLPVRQIIIWERAGGINFNPGYFLPNYEVIYFVAKPAFKLAKGSNKHGAVWKIKQESKNEHPAPFPVELAQRCVEALGEGPVLDPFMGSGTTAIAAERLGIAWQGIEQSKQYVTMARRRIASERRKTA